MPRQMQEVVAVEKAVLVCVETDADAEPYALEELRSLTETAGAEVVAEIHQHRSRPDPAYYVGKGKAGEIAAAAADTDGDFVVVDCELSPVQQRNLQEITKRRVIDRTQLILDIFGQRAHTREGKLQVELAQLTYLLPRLMNLYTEFERQQGGIGVRGGAGETKLETDRRKVRERIGDLQEELAEVRGRRGQQRALRRRLPFPTATLVGYTSAGKSTLLNTLSGADVYADPKLFATLDPTTRRVVLPDGWVILLTDTVGFVRRLPHDLIAAFRATLEEVNEADFLLHVIDASHPRHAMQKEAVERVLEELGAAGKPMIAVYNKADLVTDPLALREAVASTPNACYISATRAEGIPALMDRILQALRSLLIRLHLAIPYDRSDLVSQCHQYGRVLRTDYREDAIHVDAEVTRDLAGRLEAYRMPGRPG
ncbi:MAG TPA: GTPase HflX [Chthonomonadales bacterium]|nr:GTPase HflX [Chthonomonadales bacterium]